MFKVTIFVDDKRLPELLHNLSGVVLGQPEIYPVANAKMKGRKVVAKSNGSTGPEMFLHYLQEHKVVDFRPAEGKEICKAIGLSPTSVSYVLKALVEAKAIRHNKKTAQASAYSLVVAK
jgi:hypothetical protein